MSRRQVDLYLRLSRADVTRDVQIEIVGLDLLHLHSTRALLHLLRALLVRHHDLVDVLLGQAAWRFPYSCTTKHFHLLEFNHRSPASSNKRTAEGVAMTTILVVDDDRDIHGFFRDAFWEPNIKIISATSPAEAEAEFVSCAPDVVMLDVHLGRQSGLKVFERLHEHDPRVPMIVMTGECTSAIANEAMSLGAFEYLLKPFKVQHLRTTVHRAAEVCRLMRAPAIEDVPMAAAAQPDVIIGRCPAMQEVYKSIGRVAKQDVTTLVLGESGTGKELVARAIYQFSKRANGPFLAINCAAIPETLLESELFGHEKGAFTGAESKRIGKFEQCNGGTLFLDEIGDMTPLTQTKILRVLQEQRFERIGGRETIATNVRVIAATNCDLEKLVETGEFRQDLYYRINVFTIRLPPLRDRTEDLPLLVDHFVRLFGSEMGKEIQGIAPDALDMLRAYAWPGNVRELQSVIKQAILHATAPRLFPDFLPDFIVAAKRGPRPTVPSTGGDLVAFLHARLHAGGGELYAQWVMHTERMLLTNVLQHAQGNLSQAARILGIDRGTLRNKIKSLGIFSAESTDAADPSAD
jgi:DNA-binding NtrC family response regulator